MEKTSYVGALAIDIDIDDLGFNFSVAVIDGKHWNKLSWKTSRISVYWKNYLYYLHEFRWLLWYTGKYLITMDDMGIVSMEFPGSLIIGGR